MYTATLISALVAAAALLNGADAHGYVSSPKAEATGGSKYTSFSAEFSAAQVGNAAFNGKTFNRSPQQNAAEFTTAFKASGIKDLKTIIDAKVPGCGYTNEKAAPQDVSNLKTMDFQNNEYKEGFLGSHEGPCEVWIDDQRVFQDDDCAAHFKSYPAKLPVDYSKCSGTCSLKFYWLALHSSQWQAYKYCVPIKNGAGGGGGAAAGGAAAGGNAGGNAGGSPAVTPAAPASKAPVVAPEAAAPSPTTKKPAAAPAPAPAAPASKAPVVAPEAAAPSPTTKKPAAAPAPAPAAPAPAPAPAATKTNCKRRQRNL